MKLLIQIFIISLALVAQNGFAASTKDAFIGIKKKTLKKEYRYLAVAPLDASPALKMPDAVRRRMEEDIVARLKKEGFKVLPPEVMRNIRQHMRNLVAVGDNPGKEDAAKVAAVRDHSYRELMYRHPINGIVSVRVHPVSAPFMDDKAQWHGTSQKIKHRGDGLMKFITGKNYGGNIAASTLKIAIWDRQETLLYSWFGGIEVLMQRNAKSLEQIPPDQYWRDEKRIRNAVKLALKPL